MPEPGWFADPTGRFGQRWYDGSTWSQHVVGANGGVLEDALPESGAQYPPPPPAPPAPPQSFAPSPFPSQATGGGVRYGVGAGLVIGLVGVVLAALSLLVVPWASGDKSHFTDLTSAAHKANPTTFPDFGIHLYYVYVSWLAYVLLAAVAVLTVLAGIPVPRTGPGNRFWRIGASLLAGVAATAHSVTITYVYANSGHTAGFGALSALIGYFLVMVAMIFGARRIVTSPGRAYQAG
ncbi:DUF2510 domain-containing protein [Jatrophihabitans endophyticus]|uniref:DUF2510 domain-containing protein n=1 Tax=Jatrophihabitans endophyticus TaxID=1206085 RepID=UPI0019EBAF94|nr:DUF2510 domain-containing protein [Jatrophihabitans endophyticus]MBE7188422.1 DUF2510 domain-containing protein [Jatrophihabitans endophyticus]